MNTVLFVIAGTIVEVMLAIVFILTFFYVLNSLEPMVGDKIGTFVPLALVGGVFLAMIVYQRLSRWVIEKYGLEDKMEPLFRLRRKPGKKKNRDQ